MLLPLLFNLYLEEIFQAALAKETIGIKVNGKFINNIWFADDTVLIASEDNGLSINIKKTKFYNIKIIASTTKANWFMDK